MTANVNTINRFGNFSFDNRLQMAKEILSAIANPSEVFIESAIISLGEVKVLFITQERLEAGLLTEDDWNECTINLINLEAFVIKFYQAASFYSDVNHSIWIEENLNACVKAYIEAGKELSKW